MFASSLRSIKIRVWVAVRFQLERSSYIFKDLVYCDMNIKMHFKHEDQSVRGKGTINQMSI